MPSKATRKRVCTMEIAPHRPRPTDGGFGHKYDEIVVHTPASIEKQQRKIREILDTHYPNGIQLKERDIEKYLHKRVKEAGGEHRRVKWLGRNGAPDDAVLLHGVNFVECKAPGEKLKPHQAREHARMKRHGVPVYVLDSYAMVDKFMDHILEQVAWEYS